MENHSSKIAKNTIFLYLRTLAIMIIAIYTSRVLLEKLGVQDFGIYNLVGGVVALFASLQGVFAQSVQRFLNYERGKGNDEKVRNIFSISIYIHLGLAFVFCLIVLIFGIIYIPNYLVFPNGMLSTAMFVFYISVLTTFITIFSIPYDAVIIANEKFDFYAVISIFEVLARLSIIYLITSFDFDKLRTYSILILLVTLSFRVIRIIYAVKFPECKLRKVWDKKVFKELASFSGWNFLGNTAFSLTNEGVNFVINFFGGVSANAARGLAYQLKSAITQLSGNIVIGSRPYITEATATKEDQTIFGYIIEVSRLMYVAVVLTALPIIVYTNQILDLWLVEVPKYTVIFVQLVMIQMIIRAPQASIDLLFSSYGKMKKYQIVQSSLLFLSLPLSYILLKLNFPIYWAFISMCIVEGLTLVAITVCADLVLGFSVRFFTVKFINKSLLSMIQLCVIGFLFFHFFVPTSVVSLFLYAVLLLLIGSLDIYFCYLNKEERILINSFLRKI